MVKISYDLCNKGKIINLEEECIGYKKFCGPYETNFKYCQESSFPKNDVIVNLNFYFENIEKHVMQNMIYLFCKKACSEERETFFEEPFTPRFLLDTYSKAFNEMYFKTRIERDKLEPDIRTYMGKILTFERMGKLNKAVSDYYKRKPLKKGDIKSLADVFGEWSNKFMENLINATADTKGFRTMVENKKF